MTDALTGTIVDWDKRTGGHIRIDDERTVRLNPSNVPVDVTLKPGVKVSFFLNIFGLSPDFIKLV